jgi:hypothetical protein
MTADVIAVRTSAIPACLITAATIADAVASPQRPVLAAIPCKPDKLFRHALRDKPFLHHGPPQLK